MKIILASSAIREDSYSGFKSSKSMDLVFKTLLCSYSRMIPTMIIEREFFFDRKIAYLADNIEEENVLDALVITIDSVR